MLNHLQVNSQRQFRLSSFISSFISHRVSVTRHCTLDLRPVQHLFHFRTRNLTYLLPIDIRLPAPALRSAPESHQPSLSTHTNLHRPADTLPPPFVPLSHSHSKNLPFISFAAPLLSSLRPYSPDRNRLPTSYHNSAKPLSPALPTCCLQHPESSSSTSLHPASTQSRPFNYLIHSTS